MIFLKKAKALSFFVAVLFYFPVYGQAMVAYPKPATEVQEVVDIDLMKELLNVKTSEVDQEVLVYVLNTLQETTENELVNLLEKELSVDELLNLYNILVKSTEFEWTEVIAEKVWQVRSHKIKVESPVLYSNPRIVMIAIQPGERQFSMQLSDGSVWDVAEHLSDNSELNDIIINNLLGQYTEVNQSNETTGYFYLIAVLGFPEPYFNGYLLTNEGDRFSLEDKDLYSLWDSRY